MIHQLFADIVACRRQHRDQMIDANRFFNARVDQFNRRLTAVERSRMRAVDDGVARRQGRNRRVDQYRDGIGARVNRGDHAAG